MKKTFRKAIAVLLAVLMVAFSVPFSALAGTPDSPDTFGSTDYSVTNNRKWWVDDGVDTDLSKLQSTPEYFSYNSTSYNGEECTSNGFDSTTSMNFVADEYEDHRNDYKPVVAATVSSQGSNALYEEAVANKTQSAFAKQYYNTYYAQSASKTYDAVKAAGNIVNPANLKAGDRIAITVEVGGFDVLNNGQFKGKYNKEYLKSAYYSATPAKKDTWTDAITGAKGCIKDGTALYPDSISFAGNNVNVEDGTFYGAITGKAPVAGDDVFSNYFGCTGATTDADSTFGKYGVPSFVYSFEVLKDCDLSEVFTFDRDIAGTEFEPYYRFALDNSQDTNDGVEAVNPEYFLITGDDTKSTFANWALIWTDYEKSSEPETKSYEVKFVNAAGETVDTQTVKEGETPTAPSTNTAAKTVFNNDGTHTVTTYTWPAVSAASADVTYDEVATDKTDNCTLNYTETTKATIVSGATLTATCPVCGYVSTQTGEALNGTAYYAALNAAKAVDGTKYTADSYAKVTAALETYAQAKVEVMTSQSDVDTATKALQDAVSGLVALPTTDTYTYTFADGTTKEVTVDKGTTPTAPTNTASSVKDNGDGTHTSTSYSWNKTGDFTYSEVAKNDTASCSYGDYTVVTKATIAKAGSETATCSVCGHVDTRATAKLNGDDYYAALAAAKAVNADNYTAESYAKVADALKANAEETVEAYTDQATVDNATVALREAVNGLVKAYTITFTNAAGTVVDTQKVAAGQTPTVPSATTPATAVTSDGNGKTHSHTTYAWPAVSAATANADYKEVATKVTDKCTAGDPVVTQPTLDKEGSEVTSCTVCGQVLSTKTIPALKGVNVTVTKTAYGTTTLNSEDATNGKTTKVLANSTVTVTAKANKDAEFVGWKVAQKLVSTDETYSFTAVADTEITPVFTETAETTFVVVFVDMYGNVVDTQEVANGSEINEPTAPIYPGYTFKGWALSADEIDALTEGTTIRAVYEKDAAQTYTVKAAGATITVGGKDYTGVAEGVAYDAKVTVTKAGATSWEVNGSTVGYGESYSFFCAADVELTAVTKADDTVKTQVAIVSTVRPSNTACDVIYTATRVVGDNETIVSQGFVYGKNAVASDLTLENVGKTASGTNAGKVKVIYNKNDYTQFALNYGISAMTGTAAARAFVVTKDADGNVEVTYSDAVLYTYGA